MQLDQHQTSVLLQREDILSQKTPQEVKIISNSWIRLSDTSQQKPPGLGGGGARLLSFNIYNAPPPRWWTLSFTFPTDKHRHTQQIDEDKQKMSQTVLTRHPGNTATSQSAVVCCSWTVTFTQIQNELLSLNTYLCSNQFFLFLNINGDSPSSRD